MLFFEKSCVVFERSRTKSFGSRKKPHESFNGVRYKFVLLRAGLNFCFRIESFGYKRHWEWISIYHGIRNHYWPSILPTSLYARLDLEIQIIPNKGSEFRKKISHKAEVVESIGWDSFVEYWRFGLLELYNWLHNCVLMVHFKKW